MTVQTNISVDVKDLVKTLDRYGVDAEKFLQGAINDSAFNIRKLWLDAIKSKIDSPSPFTTNGRTVLVEKARGADIAATVYVQPTQAAYLSKLIEGGVRKAGDLATVGRSVLVPVKATLDKYGNFRGSPKGYLGSLEEKVKGAYVGTPDGSEDGRRAVYQRSKKGALKLLAVFVDTTKYKPDQLPLFDIADKYEPNVARDVENAIDRLLK